MNEAETQSVLAEMGLVGAFGPDVDDYLGRLSVDQARAWLQRRLAVARRGGRATARATAPAASARETEDSARLWAKVTEKLRAERQAAAKARRAAG